MEKIPRYGFRKQENPLLEFEIITLEDLLRTKSHLAGKPHRLDFYQIVYITEGEGVHVVDFQRVKFSKGSLIPVAKDQVQKFDTNQGIKGYVLVFTSDFLIREKINYRYLYDFTMFNSQMSPLVLTEDGELSELFTMLSKAYFNNDEFEQEELLRNYLKLILIKLERKKRANSEIECNASLSLYMKFKELLDKNVSYKTKVSDICEQLGVNSKKLNTALKLCSQKTAKELLDERVILEIKRLLSYSDSSIKEIAYKIGFEDATNMTKYFKKHCGVLPIKFREIHS